MASLLGAGGDGCGSKMVGGLSSPGAGLRPGPCWPDGLGTLRLAGSSVGRRSGTRVSVRLLAGGWEQADTTATAPATGARGAEVSEREQRRIGEKLREDLCQRLTGIEAASKLLKKRLATVQFPEVHWQRRSR